MEWFTASIASLRAGIRPLPPRVKWCILAVFLVIFCAVIAVFVVKAEDESRDESSPSPMDYHHDVVHHSDNVSF